MPDVLDISSPAAPTQPSIGWRALRGLRLGITLVILLAMAVMIGAHLVGDRALWLFYVLYAPLWPFAVVAVGWDLLLLGRALPLRFLLLCLGLGVGVMSVGMIYSPPRAPEGDVSSPSLRVLQWNVQWGGLDGPKSLERIVAEILRNDAQIICLTEAPHEGYFNFYWQQQAGDSWHKASTQGNSHSQTWFRLTVISRWPVRHVRDHQLKTGVAAEFEVLADFGLDRPIRILMVDLESEPSVPRTPSIRQAAAVIESAAAAGRPFDFVLGDFNTPARFLGFKDLARAGEGYDRAAMWSGQWRSTWPVRLVLPFRGKQRELSDTWRLSTLDIDHLWVRRQLDITSAALFTLPVVDHRGQTCSVTVDSLRK